MNPAATATPTKTARIRPGKFCTICNVKHDRGNVKGKAAKQAAMVALHGSDCTYCGEACEAPERDRVLAACNYHITNLVPACKACNNRRNQTNPAPDDAATRARIAAAMVRLLTLPEGSHAGHAAIRAEVLATLARNTD